MTSTMQRGPVFDLDGNRPVVGPDVFIAPTAAVIGDVIIGAGSSIWFSAVVRGDDMPIRIGERTNIQDGVIVHSTEDPVVIGNEVVIGHGAILHGCVVGDGALIGIGAVVLDGAIIGEGSVVAAHALVPPRKVVPPGEVWSGAPAAFRRKADPEKEFREYATAHYQERAKQYCLNLIG